MEPSDVKLAFRPADGEDLNFIFSAWLKSFRNNSWVKSAPNPVYYRYQHELIEKALSRGDCIIAHPEGSPEHILGFVAFEERGGMFIVNYLYVKQPYRKLKIATELLSKFPRVDFYTHMNGRIHPKLVESGAIYNPFLFFA